MDYYIGERLQQLREEKGWTQQNVADELDVSQQTIQNYEVNKRKPKLSTIHKLANLFEVSMEYLIGTTDNRTAIANIKPYELTESEAHHIENLRKLAPELQEVFKIASDVAKKNDK